MLIVEDEGIIAENIREVLLSLGYDPSGIAATSEEALAFRDGAVSRRRP